VWLFCGLVLLCNKKIKITFAARCLLKCVLSMALNQMILPMSLYLCCVYDECHWLFGRPSSKWSAAACLRKWWYHCVCYGVFTETLQPVKLILVIVLLLSLLLFFLIIVNIVLFVSCIDHKFSRVHCVKKLISLYKNLD